MRISFLISRSAQKLALNSWHTLRVKRRGRSFAIYLNDQHTSSGPDSFTQGSFVQLTIMDELYVGGNPNPDRISAYLPEYHELVSYKSVKGFFGCIQSVSDSSSPKNKKKLGNFITFKVDYYRSQIGLAATLKF